MRLIAIFLVILLVALAGWYLNPEEPSPAPAANAGALVIESATLENGLEVVVAPSTRVPAISHILWVKAGAIDEVKGASGVAHYLEHLLFKGTPTTPAGEYSKIITALGGNHNAFTGHDFTGYYVNIAKAHLEKVMELESDRIANVAPSDMDYEKELNVILEERKTRIDSQPTALFFEQLDAQLFVHHPYGTPIIGWKHEMEGLRRSHAEAFLAKHYTPDNMVLVLAGDITMKEALPLAKKYYGGLKGEASKRTLMQEPPQRGAKTFRMKDAAVRQPLWTRSIKMPSMVYGDTEHAMPLMLLAQWLGGDRSSVLYNELVVKQKLATSISTDYSGLRLGPGSFSITAIPAEGVSLDALGEAIDTTLASLDANLITEASLAPHKTQSIASAIFARDSLQGIGQFAGYIRMLGLPDDLLSTWGERVEAITPAQVRAVLPLVQDTTQSITGYLSGGDDA